jgi:hypothetical protein
MDAATQIAPEATDALYAMSNQAHGPEKRGGNTPGDAPVLTLNARWRIAHDGALQWILQYRSGRAETAWRGRRFHGERDALLCSIRELCRPEPVDPVALEAVTGWPQRYPSPAPKRPCTLESDDARHAAWLRTSLAEIRAAARRTGQTPRELSAAAALEREAIRRHVEWMSERPVFRPAATTAEAA